MKFTIHLPVVAGLFAAVLVACGKDAAVDVEHEKAAIQAVYEKGCAGFASGDIDAAMSPYAKDLFLFDLAPPYTSDFERLKAVNTALRAGMATTPACTYDDLVIEIASADFAYAHYILPFGATMKDGSRFAVDGRGTDIFRKVDGAWKIVHEHFSVPADPMTGKAQLLRAPSP